MAQQLQELKHAQKQLKSLLVLRLQHPLETVNEATKGLLSIHAAELTDKTKYRLMAAQESVECMERLLTEPQKETTLSTEKPLLHFERLDFSTIIHTIVADLQEIAAKSQVTIQASTQANVSILADQDRLIQLMINLVTNAINYSPVGGTIAVSTTTSQDWLEISVSDEGPGISEENRQLIFLPFEQIQASDALEKGGSGLGLYICKNIVEQHRGSIHVEPSNGNGSTFTVRLPLEGN